MKFSRVVTLKYPFDIKNIKPKGLKLNAFTNKLQDSYNVESFGAVQYEAKKLMESFDKMEEYKDYEYHVYAWRAMRKLIPGTSVVGQLNFVVNTDDRSKKIHVNVELLSPEPKEIILIPQELEFSEQEDITDSQ